MKIVEGRDGRIDVTIPFTVTRRPDPLQVERDDLLAALKALSEQTDACEKSIALEYGKPWEEPDFKPSDALAAARALIARIDTGTKSCNLHADCAAADEAVRECSGRAGALHCSDPECMRGDCAKVNGRREP